jgi:superfamily II DNA or RNA helicase
MDSRTRFLIAPFHAAAMQTQSGHENTPQRAEQRGGFPGRDDSGIVHNQWADREGRAAGMTSKFFNNQDGKTLFEKLKGIADAKEGMGDKFKVFQAVAGYFRSSGWFKLREHLGSVGKIQILVGIDIDDILRGRDMTLLFDPNLDGKLRERYMGAFVEDVKEANYAENVEKGILQLCDDVLAGRVELRIHKSRNLHAKFYLCLPENHGPNADGWVIMGSSNLTDSGLGTRPEERYELNVAMKDYDDVAYCRNEFEKLWAEGVPLTAEDIQKARQRTHLGQEPTPFELFMRVLIDLYGEQAEDHFDISLPEGMMDLKYQRDAVVQGYQMLKKYNGFFLADVVGLGKTVVAAMIAKRFIEENGKLTKILVVYPPAIEQNWKETFETFGITKRQVRFVSNGSLHKVLDEHEGSYWAPDEYDMVIVDEAHRFRNSGTQSFDRLQRICRAPRPVGGHVPGTQKKVLLVTATALNNTPEDLLNQIRLFQDDRACTIDGVRDIAGFFSPLVRDYLKEMREARQTGRVNTKAIDDIYETIRRKVLEKIIIRRTRQNILNDENYKKDLDAQGIVFPEIRPPREVLYQMDDRLADLFTGTIRQLESDLDYARYRAIEFLKPEYQDRYPNAQQVATVLSRMYRTFMVKRLESSFYAFKTSLRNFLRATRDMIRMFEADSVLIIPDLDVPRLIEEGYTFEEIVEIAEERRGYEREDISYPAAAFDPHLLELLKSDAAKLEALAAQWQSVTKDPKLDCFVRLLGGELFETERNPGGKLVVFSESTDTLEYLEKELAQRLGRTDILRVDAGNRAGLKKTIRDNFDANWAGQKNDYNILLCSDALAEGVNLHRANIVVNYDSPWNATRLMQRIGRVNRIGSPAGTIHNYLFYPSRQGNQIISLYQNSLIKMQGFHAALGEDAQIYSREELLHQFELYNANPHDDMDDHLRYLRLVREFHAEHPADYERLKRLPVKCRVSRAGGDGGTVVYLANAVRTAFYEVTPDGTANQRSSLEILRRLEAKPEESAVPWTPRATNANYEAVQAVLELFGKTAPDSEDADSPRMPTERGNRPATAKAFLLTCNRWVDDGNLPQTLLPAIKALRELVEIGRYVQLDRALYDLSRQYSRGRLPTARFAQLGDELESLHATYRGQADQRPKTSSEAPLTLIASETFTGDTTP